MLRSSAERSLVSWGFAGAVLTRQGEYKESVSRLPALPQTAFIYAIFKGGYT
jgi:hypothetical protein